MYKTVWWLKPYRYWVYLPQQNTWHIHQRHDLSFDSTDELSVKPNEAGFHWPTCNTLETENCYDANFAAPGGTGGCHTTTSGAATYDKGSTMTPLGFLQKIKYKQSCLQFAADAAVHGSKKCHNGISSTQYFDHWGKLLVNMSEQNLNWAYLLGLVRFQSRPGLLLWLVPVNFYPYSPGLLHWDPQALTPAPVPVKQLLKTIGTYRGKSIKYSWKKHTKQRKTNPCACFTGYT